MRALIGQKPCFYNYGKYGKVQAIAYAILNGTENLRFGKEGHLCVLVYGLFYTRKRKLFFLCSHTL